MIDWASFGRRLRVPARTTSFAFKGRNVPVPEIARQLGVAHVLEVRLARGSRTAGGVVATGTADPEAYELYLRGLHAWNRRGAAAPQQAAGYFEQALDRDSSFARGWTGPALTYVLMPD